MAVGEGRGELFLHGPALPLHVLSRRLTCMLMGTPALRSREQSMETVLATDEPVCVCVCMGR